MLIIATIHSKTRMQYGKKEGHEEIPKLNIVGGTSTKIRGDK